MLMASQQGVQFLIVDKLDKAGPRPTVGRYKSRERMRAASKCVPVTLHLLTGGGLKPDQWRFRTNDTQAPDELTHARHSPFIAQKFDLSTQHRRRQPSRMRRT